MPTIAGIKIDLELATAKFTRQASQIRRGINSIGDTSTRVGRIVGNIIPAGGLVGIAAATKQSLDYADSIQKLSIRLGASTEGLTRLGFAAEQTGVSQETLNLALQRQTRRISEAANGTGEAVKALDELGLSAESLNQLRPEDQFRALSDAIQTVENPADRVRIAMKLFDTEGVALVQTMEGGSAALDAFGEEADRLGITLSRSAVDKASAANDALNRLSRASQGLTQSLAIQLGPTIEKVANFMTQALTPTLDFIGRAFDGLRFIILTFAQKTVEAVGFVVRQFARLEAIVGGTTLSDFAGDIEFLSESLEFTASRFLEGATGAAKFNSEIADIPANVSQAQRSLSGISGGDITPSTVPAAVVESADSVLVEIEVQSKRIEASLDAFAPAQGETYFDKFFGENSLQNLFSDFDNIEQNFKQLVANMVTELLTSQLSSAISSVFGGGGGSSGGGVSGFFGSLFGARATGGPVTGNRPYLVGEQGPELFVPGSNGTVLPNAQGAGGVVVNMKVVAKDADSFRRSQGQISTDLARELRRAGRNG